MNNNYLTIYVITVLMLFVPLNGHAEESPVDVTFGVSLQPSKWEGDNKTAGTSFDANATELQLNLRIRKGGFYTGLSFQGASFDFNGTAPEKVTKIGVSVPSSNTTVERGEFDLVFGYYFWKQVSFFADFKRITNKWDDTGYAARYNGLGLGVTGWNPVSENWIFFGSLGFVGLNIETGGGNIGDGNGGTLVLGFLYKATNHSQFTIGLKSQQQTYKFDNGSEQKHGIGSLVLGYSYTL
ncbi:hypothetical protein [Kaarinaea lacus]